MWVKNEYYYSSKMLMVIADNYDLYNPDNENFNTKHWQETIEYKVDFDRALNGLSKRQKRVVWAKDDDYYYLERMGFYNINSFRYLSFNEMAEYLNS